MNECVQEHSHWVAIVGMPSILAFFFSSDFCATKKFRHLHRKPYWDSVSFYSE
jgi:hypothetical protein